MMMLMKMWSLRTLPVLKEMHAKTKAITVDPCVLLTFFLNLYTPLSIYERGTIITLKAFLNRTNK